MDNLRNIMQIVYVIFNIICFVIMYFFMRFNVESAFMFALFIAIVLYKKLDSNIKDSKLCQILYQCVSALFCAVFFDISIMQTYIIQSSLALVFIRIYDIYKPSVISRFYNSPKNAEFSIALSSILIGILSSISVLLCFKILEKFGFSYHNFSIIPS